MHIIISTAPNFTFLGTAVAAVPPRTSSVNFVRHGSKFIFVHLDELVRALTVNSNFVFCSLIIFS